MGDRRGGWGTPAPCFPNAPDGAPVRHDGALRYCGPCASRSQQTRSAAPRRALTPATAPTSRTWAVWSRARLAPVAADARECPYRLCDGSGMVVDLQENTTYRCRCWPERVSRRRARRLSREVPKRFQNLGFEREPIPSIARTAPDAVRAVRRYCDRVDEMLDRGEGMWFLGSPGTGKSHLAYLISQHALAAGRSVAIYTGPRLLDEIRRTYGEDDSGSTLDLIDRLTTVELLHIEDLAVARPTDWVLDAAVQHHQRALRERALDRLHVRPDGGGRRCADRPGAPRRARHDAELLPPDGDVRRPAAADGRRQPSHAVPPTRVRRGRGVAILAL